MEQEEDFYNTAPRYSWDYYDDEYYYDEYYDWQERENPCHPTYYQGDKNTISKNILVSDFGIVVKGGSNTPKSIVFVSDLKTTEAVKDAKIKVLNLQQQVIYEGVTDANGEFVFASNPKPFMVIVEKNGVKGYLKLDEVYTLGYFTNTLFVSKKSNIQNFKQLTELSKTREIIFGHGGYRTYSHQAMQTVCEKTLRCLDVAYKGGSQGMVALMSGEIDAFAITTYGTKQFFENNNLLPIYNITTKEKNWVKLFAKNIPLAERELISNVLKSQDFKFYTDMGFEK